MGIGTGGGGGGTLAERITLRANWLREHTQTDGQAQGDTQRERVEEWRTEWEKRGEGERERKGGRET